MYKSNLEFSELIRLYKEDLLDLDKIIKENLLIDQENNDYKIKVSYKNREITKSSMDDLLAENLPEIVDNIEISVITLLKERNETSKYLRISFFGTRRVIYVAGENEVWVNGISSILNNFFVDKVAPYSSFKKSLPFISSGLAGVSVPIMILLYIKGSYILGTMLLLCIPLFGAFSKKAIRQFPYIKIMMYSKKSKQESEKNNFLNIGTLIALLSLVVGVLSLIVDIIK